MNAVRAFIAIDLSSEIQERLDEVISQLKERLPDISVRWVPAQNIHLTLKFLGDVSTSNLEMLYEIIKREAIKQPSFELSVGNLGAFPSVKRPRVVWVGIEAPSELYALQRGIENEFAHLGYAREKRSFSPHLTIGRVSRNANSSEVRELSNVLSNCKVGFLGATRVSEVYLYRSDLRPDGAKYTQLFSAGLT